MEGLLLSSKDFRKRLGKIGIRVFVLVHHLGIDIHFMHAYGLKIEQGLVMVDQSCHLNVNSR